MKTESSLAILGSDKPYRLVVEPWATEYEIYPKDRCAILVKHKPAGAIFTVEPLPDDGVVVGVELSGATYEFFRNGKREEEMPVPTPKLGGG